MPLTTTALNAATGKEKQYKLRDGEGLFVLVTPSGKRYWRLDFRHGGKAKTMALGVYPAVGLADARRRRDEARKLIASGVDPVQQRKADDRETRLQSGSTFRVVAKEWLDKCKAEGRAEKTLERNEWLLGIAYPLLGDRPIAEISAIELLDVLKKVELHKHHETACRLRSLCGCVFRFAIATCRAKADVSADLLVQAIIICLIRLVANDRPVGCNGSPRKMPYLQARSAVFAPASASFNTPIICSSVNRVRFIGPSFLNEVAAKRQQRASLSSANH